MPENDSIIPSIDFTANRRGEVKSLAHDIASYGVQSEGETIDPNLLGLAYNIGVTNRHRKNKSKQLNRLVSKYARQNHLHGEGTGDDSAETTVMTGSKRDAKKAARLMPYLSDKYFEARFGFSPWELNSGSPLKFINNRGKDITKKFMRPYDRNLMRADKREGERADMLQRRYNIRHVGGKAGEQAMQGETLSGREKIAHGVLGASTYLPFGPWGIGAGLGLGLGSLMSMGRKWGGNGFNTGQFLTGLGITAASAVPLFGEYIRAFGMPAALASAGNRIASSSLGRSFTRFGNKATRFVNNTVQKAVNSGPGQAVINGAERFASSNAGEKLHEAVNLIGDLYKGLDPTVDPTDIVSGNPASSGADAAVTAPVKGYLDADTPNPHISYEYKRPENTIIITVDPYVSGLQHNYGGMDVDPLAALFSGRRPGFNRYVENNFPDVKSEPVIRSKYGQAAKIFKNIKDEFLPNVSNVAYSPYDLTSQIKLIGDEISRGRYDNVLGITRYEGMKPINFKVTSSSKPSSALLLLESENKLSLPKPNSAGEYAVVEYNGIINNDLFKPFDTLTGKEIPIYDASGNRVYRVVNPEIRFDYTVPSLADDRLIISWDSLDPKADLGVDLDMFSNKMKEYIQKMNDSTRSNPLSSGMDFVPGMSAPGHDSIVKGLTGNMDHIIHFSDTPSNFPDPNSFRGGFTYSKKGIFSYTPAIYRTDGIRDKDLITISLPYIQTSPTFYDNTAGKLRVIPNLGLYSTLSHEYAGHLLDFYRDALDAFGVEFRDESGKVIPYLPSSTHNYKLQSSINDINGRNIENTLIYFSNPSNNFDPKIGYLPDNYLSGSHEVNARNASGRVMSSLIVPELMRNLAEGSNPFATKSFFPIDVPSSMQKTFNLFNFKPTHSGIFQTFDDSNLMYNLLDVYGNPNGTTEVANGIIPIPFLDPNFGKSVNGVPYDYSIFHTKPFERSVMDEAARHGYRKGGKIGFTDEMIRRASSFFARGGVMDSKEPLETTDYSGYTGDQMYNLLGMDTGAFNSAIKSTFFIEPYNSYSQTLDFNDYKPLYRNPLNNSGRLALLHTDRLNTINRMFAEAGIGPVQRAALLASIIHESKGNPAEVDKKNGFYGLMQWSKERFPDFEKHKHDLAYQVNKIIDELKSMPVGSWTDGAAGGKVVKHANEGRWEFFRATDPYEAAFYLNKCYVRPYSSDVYNDNTANRLAAYDNRGKEAKNIFRLFGL